MTVVTLSQIYEMIADERSHLLGMMVLLSTEHFKPTGLKGKKLSDQAKL